MTTKVLGTGLDSLPQTLVIVREGAVAARYVELVCKADYEEGVTELLGKWTLVTKGKL